MFGTEWVPLEQIISNIGSVNEVIEWAKWVRQQSHDFISMLSPEDYQKVPETYIENLSVGHWINITSCHTALHIGKIQLIRDMLLGQEESPC